MNLDQAIEAAERWIAADPDPVTQLELRDLVSRRDETCLLEAMAGSLEFGTAGLRALVGAGPRRMNRAVARRAAEGIARYLTRGQADELQLVVGADARLSSPALRDEVVGVLAAHGLRVFSFSAPVATPIVAYVAKRLGAAAGLVITASHNPAAYNGLKIYGSHALQIAPPVDARIAAEIQACPPASEIPLAPQATLRRLVSPPDAALVEDYYREVGELGSAARPARDLRVVHTAMHGVGHEPVSRVLREAGFRHFLPVPEQQQPDGRFPTAPFPNPEEEGALDLAIDLARRSDAELVIASDPDVDRLAAAVPGPRGFKRLTGNQVGLLLADFLLERAAPTPMPLVVQSLVSSPMLSAIARSYGADCERTLTGFKWIWTAALARCRSGARAFTFAFEEALGYSVGSIVHDKDGISAALVLCELAALEKSRDRSLLDRLESLYRLHGLWVSVQRSRTLEGRQGARRIARTMSSLAADPPRQIAEHTVTEVVDYSQGGHTRPAWLPNASLVELRLGEAGRVLVRPSGTEPKLKLYLDLRRPLTAGSDVWSEEEAATAGARALGDELLTRLERQSV